MKGYIEPKPVKKIELDERHIKLRIILLIVFSLLAVGAIFFTLYKIANKDNGWQQVTLRTRDSAKLENDFYFSYYVKSASEYRKVSAAYDKYFISAKKDLDDNNDYSNNVYYINHHPNTEIEISPFLYECFSDILSDTNYLYLGSINHYYDQIIYNIDDTFINKYDPMSNTDIANIVNDLLTYINNGDVELKLLDDNKIKLYVSNDYLSFLDYHDIDKIIDFSWLENAYIIDYLKTNLKKDGFKRGIIRTYDGYNISLDDDSYNYKYTLFDEINNHSGKIGEFIYNANSTIVNFKNFIVYNKDMSFIRYMSDNTRRTYYISNIDGFSKASTRYLLSYSNNSCVKTAKMLSNIYINDTFDESLINLNKDNYNFIWYDNYNVYHTDKDVEINITFSTEEYKYTEVLYD